MLRTEKIFDLFEFYRSNSLSTREEANKFFMFYFQDELTSLDSISLSESEYTQETQLDISLIKLDFSNIEFVSRSFADQFIKQEINFRDKFQISFELVNATESIQETFKVVSQTQNSKLERPVNTYKVVTHNNFIYLYRYLLSM